MIKIFYIRDKFGKNYGTVAYDISNKSSGNVTFAVASCNSKDAFSKHSGIEIATSRLISAPVTIGIRPNASNADIVKSILTKISRSDVGSNSGRKLARKMLKKHLTRSSREDCFGCC